MTAMFVACRRGGAERSAASHRRREHGDRGADHRRGCHAASASRGRRRTKRPRPATGRGRVADPRAATLASPMSRRRRLRILLADTAAARRERGGMSGRQRRPVRLRLQHRGQQSRDRLAVETPVGRSASRRARSQTPRCPRACRRLCPRPARAPCRRPCRGSCRRRVIAGDVIVGEFATSADVATPQVPSPSPGRSRAPSPCRPA